MLKYVILVAIFAIANAADEKAIVVLNDTTSGVAGTITFIKTAAGIEIEGQVTGLTPGNHGFHVHALGDLSNGCTSTGSHFNPQNVTHGGPNDTVRHVGDLGNIVADANGIANVSFTDSIIALDGAYNIIGRAIVVHEGEDDYGKGGQSDSLTTGHAGNRLACGIIGTL